MPTEKTTGPSGLWVGRVSQCLRRIIFAAPLALLYAGAGAQSPDRNNPAQSSASQRPLPATRNTKAGPMLAPRQYRNIRVLKTLPAARLLPTMHEYTRALSVNCQFCHTTKGGKPDYASDVNPIKAQARSMIVLVQTLNARHPELRGQATCYMCHQGHPEPVVTAPQSEPVGADLPAHLSEF